MDHSETEVRTCRECNTTYPLTREYWHKDRRGKGGWRTNCAACNNLKRRQDRLRAKSVEARADTPGHLPPCVRVVENVKTGKRRPLGYTENEPGQDEVWVGVGYDLLRIEEKHGEKAQN